MIPLALKIFKLVSDVVTCKMRILAKLFAFVLDGILCNDGVKEKFTNGDITNRNFVITI